MKVYGGTDVGLVRTSNQDSYLIQQDESIYLENLYIVADGMGGHSSGEVASATAVNEFAKYIKNTVAVKESLTSLLLDATQKANEKVFWDAVDTEAYQGMGTTFTALSIKAGVGYVAHIGDSRLYLIRAGELVLKTEDHSFVYELMKAGKISKEEARVHQKRHQLTRALGPDLEPEVDAFSFDLQVGDRLLMCTDGLSNMVEDEALLATILNTALEEVIPSLLKQANQKGGQDNITAIIIEIEGDDYAA